MTNLLAGLSEADVLKVANAVGDHYKPAGPSDAVPSEPVAIAVALADKLDTLVGFWAIDEKPTGSKDPFALRRAALGVIRILLEGGARLPLDYVIRALLVHMRNARGKVLGKQPISRTLSEHIEEMDLARELAAEIRSSDSDDDHGIAFNQLMDEYDDKQRSDLLSFFADRLKVHLKDEGVRFDVIDAVFSLGDDDLVRVTKKARALQGFLETGDGAALLAGYRRAANILKAEEKKGFDLTAARAEALSEISAAVDASEKAHAPETGEQDEAAILVAVAKTSQAAEEKALIAAIEGAETVAQAALAKEDFEGAMRALAGLRAPVDSFFDAVVVNVDNDDKLRRNRLLLLSRIRASVERVADFGKLEG